VRELVVLPAALRDIDHQAAYYRDQGSPETATRWLERTRRTFEFVAANPALGATIGPGLRAWRIERFKQHIVVYRTLEERIEVVRVLHGASDLDRLV
jgi:toxin ParE1/3/4